MAAGAGRRPTGAAQRPQPLQQQHHRQVQRQRQRRRHTPGTARGAKLGFDVGTDPGLECSGVQDGVGVLPGRGRVDAAAGSQGLDLGGQLRAGGEGRRWEGGGFAAQPRLCHPGSGLGPLTASCPALCLCLSTPTHTPTSFRSASSSCVASCSSPARHCSVSPGGAGVGNLAMPYSSIRARNGPGRGCSSE